MSPSFLVATVICVMSFILSSWFLWHSLRPLSNDGGGLRQAYRRNIDLLLAGDVSGLNIISLLNFISLHLLVPCMGFGVFLTTDLNFLVFIVSIIWSMKLFQRLYPASEVKQSDEANDSIS